MFIRYLLRRIVVGFHIFIIIVIIVHGVLFVRGTLRNIACAKYV